jgi:hypothetical protein
VPRYEVVPAEHCTGSHLLTHQALRGLLGLPRVVNPTRRGRALARIPHMLSGLTRCEPRFPSSRAYPVQYIYGVVEK